MAVVNRNYKDSLFVDLFGSKERKGFTLDLYNALNGTNYSNAEAIDIITIDGAIYMAKKHDVAFLVDGRAVLWEQQSTINPNMPLRALFYFAQIYERYIREHAPHGRMSLYGEVPIALPIARFVVFYIGRKDQPESFELHLSEAFGNAKSDLDISALVLNLNAGCNEALKRACPSLSEYSVFVLRVRELQSQVGLEAAIRKALDERIALGAIPEYFEVQREKVVDMILEEYDEAEVMAMLAEQAEQRGIEQGIEQGIKQGIEQVLSAAEDVGLDVETLAAIKASLARRSAVE